MGKIEKHAPGAFCWVELETTDIKAASAFYSALLTWDVKDVSAGEMLYSIFQWDGLDAAGLYQLVPAQTALGCRPNWMIFVAVESADATAASAVELGGKVLVGPANAMEAGRFAVLQDPQGAVIGIWQPMKHTGNQVGGMNHRHCWSELAAADIEGSVAFYTKLFGWTVTEQNMGGGVYHVWANQGMPGGGMYPVSALGPGIPPHWLAYFSVPDCDGAAAKAQALGATIKMPPTNIPDVGRFTILSDPQGAAVALIQLVEH